jgi:hypothetical protein
MLLTRHIAVILTAAFALSLSASAFAATSGAVSAEPVSLVLKEGETGTATITWSAADVVTAQVYMSVDGVETLVAEGLSGTVEIKGLQPGKTYFLKLYANKQHSELLGCAVVIALAPGTSVIAAFPRDVVLLPEQLGRATITWTADGVETAQIYVSLNGADETLFAGGPAGRQDAPWIQAGATYEFKMYKGLEHKELLGTVTIKTPPPEEKNPEYKIGVNYHAYGADFEKTGFLTQYNDPEIRKTVKAQLQDMADRGASIIKTNLWMVYDKSGNNQSWQFHFPPSEQEIANVKAYAEDVAAITAKDGHHLKLYICLLWLWAAEYAVGTPETTLGHEDLTADEFTKRVKTTYTSVIDAVSGITRPDNEKVVDIIYLNGEVMVGARKNEEWFLKTLWPGFVEYCKQKGLTPSLYFIASGPEAVVLDDSITNAQYPFLNGHRSICWVYLNLKFMADQGWELPARIDFSCYIDPRKHTYDLLAQHVLDDADEILPTLGAPKKYGVVETWYPLDKEKRRALGKAWAAQSATNRRLNCVLFWTTPDGGAKGQHVGFPFEIEDYLP